MITAPPDRLVPRSVLYVHVSADTLRDGTGAARIEQVGAVTAQQAKAWLTGCRIRVVPVIDLNTGPVVDAYEVTGRLREQVVLRDGFDIFPFGDRPARRCDVDHAVPFGIAGRTDPANLNPLGRGGHQAKTHGRWRRTNAGPGQTEWRSPVGNHYLVQNGRTTIIGPPE